MSLTSAPWCQRLWWQAWGRLRNHLEIRCLDEPSALCVSYGSPNPIICFEPLELSTHIGVVAACSLSLSVSVLHVCGLCFSICLSSPLLWENPNAKKNNPRAQLKQMPKLPHHQDSNSLPQRTTWTPKATSGCGGRWSKPKKRVHSQMFMVSLKGGFTVSTIRKAVT